MLPANRDFNVSVEGDITTSAGNWFQIQMVAGKKLLIEGVDVPSWNTQLTTVPSHILGVMS